MRKHQQQTHTRAKLDLIFRQIFHKRYQLHARTTQKPRTRSATDLFGYLFSTKATAIQAEFTCWYIYGHEATARRL